MVLPKCCGSDSVWIDNVPGKEYYFCKLCKQEVFTVNPVFPTYTMPADEVTYFDEQMEALSELMKVMLA